MLFSLLLHTSWCHFILLNKLFKTLKFEYVVIVNRWDCLMYRMCPHIIIGTCNQRVMVSGRKMLVPPLSGKRKINTPYFTSCKVTFIRLVTVYCCYYISEVNETYTIHKSVTGITRSGLKRSYLPRGYKFLSKPKKKYETGRLMESRGPYFSAPYRF